LARFRERPQESATRNHAAPHQFFALTNRVYVTQVVSFD